MKEKLEAIVQEAREQIAGAATEHDLLNLKSHFIGKKSELSGFLQKMRDLKPEERPAFGKLVNHAKQRIGEFLEEAANRIRNRVYQESLQKERVDLTMPGRRMPAGALHPITLAWRKLEDVFLSLGFQIAEGPDIEDEYHNFDALNHPHDHPARDLSDTFYIEEDVLLRTHTSPVQIRVMEQHKPPIRIVSPGRCYRNDNDASHSPAFHQLEALVVDKGVRFTDLRDMLNIFVKKMFGTDIESRIRPHFFPFTEPSAELDMLCSNCKGAGCSLCKQQGWIEVGGAGMVDPNVLEYVDIDPEVYTGYAFGMGIDRIALLLYGIPDMRMLFENDMRLLSQFSGVLS